MKNVKGYVRHADYKFKMIAEVVRDSVNEVRYALSSFWYSKLFFRILISITWETTKSVVLARINYLVCGDKVPVYF